MQLQEVEWNFQGCAVSGKAAGLCLEPVEAIKDYWFDWRNYNAEDNCLSTAALAEAAGLGVMITTLTAHHFRHRQSPPALSIVRTSGAR